MGRSAASKIGSILVAVLAVSALILFETADKGGKESVQTDQPPIAGVDHSITTPGETLSESLNPPAPVASNPRAGPGPVAVLSDRIAEEKNPRDDLDSVRFFGRTLSGSGAPLGNVTVEIGDSNLAGDGAVLTVQTDEAGLFQVELPAQRHWFYVRESEAWREASFATSDFENEVILLLHPRGRQQLTLAGTVRDPDGVGLAGVRVSRPSPAEKAWGETDEDGHYQLMFRVTPNDDPYHVFFWYRSLNEATGVSTSVLEHVEIFQSEHDTEGIYRRDVVLDPTANQLQRAPVSVQVLDLRGRPVRARVNVAPTGSGGNSGGHTDLNGIFQGEVQAENHYDIEVAAQPSPDQPASNLRPKTVPEVFVGAEGVSLTVHLEDAQHGTIHARVLTADRHILADFPMELVYENFASIATVRTDSAGTFFIEDVPEGHLRFRSYSRVQLEMFGIHMQPGEVKQLTLFADVGDAAISGHLLGPDSRPLPAKTVSLTWTYPEGTEHMMPGTLRFRRSVGVEEGFAGSLSIRTTTTDEDGWFAFYGIANVPHTLRLRDSPNSWSSNDWRQTVEPGNQPVRLIVRPEDAGDQ
ncbi:MAG: carboxypeptidase-like regulatory domain-containing protein [Xanthomonadales bacterium]|nr:carboxypeptidase-like regulatory domain-containing protein [Xanthomonadales bacterium]